MFKGHSVGLCLFSSPTPMPAIPPPRENRPPAGALEALGCRHGFVTPPLPGCLQLRTQPSGGLLLTLPHPLFGGDCPRPRVLHPSTPHPEQDLSTVSEPQQMWNPCTVTRWMSDCRRNSVSRTPTQHHSSSPNVTPVFNPLKQALPLRSLCELSPDHRPLPAERCTVGVTVTPRRVWRPPSRAW